MALFEGFYLGQKIIVLLRHKSSKYSINYVMLGDGARLDQSRLYVTESGKTGLMAYFKVSGGNDFKYLKCYSLPMVLATCRNFSHIIEQCITFQIIH